MVYCGRLETLNLDRAKTPGFDDRKRVHISNIDPFTIVKSREFSRRSKSTFQADRSIKRRKPTHPGEILDELYIKPLKLNLQKLADRLGIARNTLFKIRSEEASVTPSIALSLAEAFDTTPQLWLNLQINHDLWVGEHGHVPVLPIIKNGEILPTRQNRGISRMTAT
jgi:addiction module HigA family antidote